MGFISGLFGCPRPMPPFLLGANAFDFGVVGESFYQEALERLAGGRKFDPAHVRRNAILLPEDDNPHDEHAVAVLIRGQKVGHIGHELSGAFRRRMLDLGVQEGVSCSAEICGGWDRGCGDTGYFGVKLDLVWPLCLAPK
jgi:hypothetical protein